MGARILVVYASRCGSTEEIAREIGRVIAASGVEADVKRVGEVADLGGYAGVVVGSAVRMGRWLPGALRFVRGRQASLARLRAACFTVGASLRDGTEESRRRLERAAEPARAALDPVDEAFFAGKVDRSRLGRVWRLVLDLARAPEGDFRDWGAIRAWASGLAGKLVSEP